MYTTDFAYDGPIFLVPLSPSYPSSPVLSCLVAFLKQKISSNFSFIYKLRILLRTFEGKYRSEEKLQLSFK